MNKLFGCFSVREALSKSSASRGFPQEHWLPSVRDLVSDRQGEHQPVFEMGQWQELRSFKTVTDAGKSSYRQDVPSLALKGRASRRVWEEACISGLKQTLGSMDNKAKCGKQIPSDTELPGPVGHGAW